jgi:hypothetical protein
MSLLSWIFGTRDVEIERQIKVGYVELLHGRGIMSRTDAEKAVQDAIVMCKQQGAMERTDKLPRDFGDRILVAANAGEPKSKRIVEKARKEGANDEDIAEWWNMPDLCRHMVIWSENCFRHMVFLHALDDDQLSAELAAARVHKMFPIYGDPDDTSKLSEENRPIPHELRGRIDLYREKHGVEYITAQVRNFTSYNAFVRHAVRNTMI